MATVKRRDLPPSREGQEIVKLLARLTYSRRQDDVYSDFLRLSEIYLRRLPTNVLHVVEHAALPPDDGEDTTTWQRIARKYSKQEMHVFAHALDRLLFHCDGYLNTAYHDYLGEIYMFWGWPNANMGQYFTPYHLAAMMASMTMGDIEQECRRTVASAIANSMFGLVADGLGESITRPGKENLMLSMLPLVYNQLKPVEIHEPCIGSGVMLLAAAAACPRWAVDYGVVQFSGQDIDPDCVLMAKLNFMLYGLNGYYMGLTAAAHGLRPDGSIAPMHPRAQEALRRLLAPTRPAANNEPALPAPVDEPLPTLAPAAPTPARPRPASPRGKRITLPPANQITQLSMLDLLAQRQPRQSSPARPNKQLRSM